MGSGIYASLEGVDVLLVPVQSDDDMVYRFYLHMV